MARRIQIDTPLATAVCAFVIAGMGIAVIDRLSAMDNSYRGIIVRPLRPRLAEDLILVTPAHHALSRIADAFAGHLRRYCATVLRPANT